MNQSAFTAGGGAASPLPIVFEFFAGGSILQAGGITNSVEVRTAGTIGSWSLFVRADDGACSVALDILKTSVGSYGAGTSIVAAAAPGMILSKSASSSTLTGWTTAVSVGDVFYARIITLVGSIRGLTLELRA